MRSCKVCGTIIPTARIEILPETQVCVAHSEEKPKRAFIEGSASHKTWDVVILSGDDPTVRYWEDRETKY